MVRGSLARIRRQPGSNLNDVQLQPVPTSAEQQRGQRYGDHLSTIRRPGFDYIRSMIRRRASLIGAFATALPFAQPVGSASKQVKVFRVGVVESEREVDEFGWNEFLAELSRLGFVEGKNVVFLRRFGERLRPDLLNGITDELVALNVDVIYVASGVAGTLAAKASTKVIPIVFFSSTDPVGLGLVASLSRPGANVTGQSASAIDYLPKTLEFLVEAMGKRNARVVEIQPTGTRSSPTFFKLSGAMNAAANRLKVDFEYVDVASIDEVPPLVKRLRSEGIDALIVSSYPMFYLHLEKLAALLIEHRIPSIGNPHQGFLLDYSAEYLALLRNAARYVAKVLRGAKPSDMPVELASKFNLAINLRTAKAIGLKVPPSLLARADELIE